jgi:uncharacterized protein
MTARASLLSALPLTATLLALPLAAGFLALPGPAHAASPSFDCLVATLPVEKAICRSATLSAFDIEIAEAYGRAMSALSDGMRDTLRKAQRTFLAARNEAFGLPEEDLEQRMADQVAFLKAIETRGRFTLEGAWRNGIGGIDVKVRPDGVAEVMIGTTEQTRALWLCELQGEARQGPDGWVLRADPGLADGWIVTLAPRGGQLGVTTRPITGPDGPAPGEPLPFCGLGGTIDGDYLPVRPQIDWGQ